MVMRVPVGKALEAKAWGMTKQETTQRPRWIKVVASVVLMNGDRESDETAGRVC